MSTDIQRALAARAEAARRVVMQAAVLKALKQVHDEDRAALTEDMARGDKITTHDTAGTSLGTVSYSDPKPKARVTDRELFTGHVAGDRPDEIGFKITDLAAAVGVLEEVAPHLLAPAVPSHIEAEYTRAAEGGQDVPGVTVTTGAPVLSCRPSQTGKAAADELIGGSAELTAPRAIEGADND